MNHFGHHNRKRQFSSTLLHFFFLETTEKVQTEDYVKMKDTAKCSNVIYFITELLQIKLIL